MSVCDALCAINVWSIILLNVSSCHYVCVHIPLYMCSHYMCCEDTWWYVVVRGHLYHNPHISLNVCPHSTLYHTTMYVTIPLYMCLHTIIYDRIPLCVLTRVRIPQCVLIPLYMCPHTTATLTSAALPYLLVVLFSHSLPSRCPLVAGSPGAGNIRGVRRTCDNSQCLSASHFVALPPGSLRQHPVLYSF